MNIANQPITVHTYASPGAGSVNTHWIEYPAGVVVIDGQRLISQARVVVQEIARTGKRVEAIVLTHAHPDHIGGVRAFVDAYPSARIVASRATCDSMHSDEGGLIGLARYWLGQDFDVVFPAEIVDGNRVLALEGLSLEFIQLGPGEASCMDVLYLPETGALFAADVVLNSMTPFLAEGRTRMWLAQIDVISQEFPHARIIYPGHGAPDNARVLLQQSRDYLIRFQELIRRRMAESKELTPEIRSSLIAEVERMYPEHQPVAAIPDLIGMNVDGVWRELASEAGTTATAAST